MGIRNLMRPILSREQIREFDRHAIEDLGVPSLMLMENAGRGAADIAFRELARMGKAGQGPVLVVCGRGNNGGDGFVVARRLRVLGVPVKVFLTGAVEQLKGDARLCAALYEKLGGTIQPLGSDAELAVLDAALGEARLVVDALFGTGLDREVVGVHRSVIERVNHAATARLALDIPSGIHANTGQVLGVAVRADVTVSFAHLKLGLLTTASAEHVGRLEVVDIGVPGSLCKHTGWTAELIETSDAANWICPRPIGTHKGSAGRVLVVAGSPGKTGAALLAARGALRAGAGLVTLASFPEAVRRFESRVLEEITLSIDPLKIDEQLLPELERSHAVVVGPGLGTDASAAQLVERVIACERPVVMDADALSLFAGRAEALRAARARLILTPHPGEMGRLLGISVGQVEADRFAALNRLVEQSQAVVILKGPRTLIGAPGELTLVNGSGTKALATAGAGDVLAGITAALACHLPSKAAASCGVFLHGLAGEAWVQSMAADRGLLAHEIAEALPSVIARMARSETRLTS